MTDLSTAAHVILAVLQARQRHNDPPIPIADLAWHTSLPRRTCERALTELALAGYPVVSSTARKGGGIVLTDDPAAVRACARAYGRRIAAVSDRIRALERTATQLEQPTTLWRASS